MPRIATVDLVQVNNQIDKIDNLQSQVGALKANSDFVTQQVTIADPIHAVPTTNNLTFTWTGSSSALTWSPGFIKDKNWQAQTLPRPVAKSSAPGQQHVYGTTGGTLNLNPSTYYWVGWDYVHRQMVANVDASVLHGNFNVHVLCQIYTGTSGQTGVAGGGGSTGGVDLSGSRYKNF
jgi:hypothetical protein